MGQLHRRAQRGRHPLRDQLRGRAVPGDDRPGDVVPGWEDGLVGATTGSQIQIDVPADEGYGDVGVPAKSVPEDAALSFLVDVVAIVPATEDAGAPTDLELPISEEPLDEIVVDDVTVGDGAELTTDLTGYADVYLVCANNGVVIDNSWGAENRVELPMQTGQLMDGLLEGLEGMKEGGRRIISVPADLALGSAGNVELDIGANHDLIFVVDLYAVIDPTPPPPVDRAHRLRASRATSTETNGTNETTEPTESTERNRARPTSERPRHTDAAVDPPLSRRPDRCARDSLTLRHGGRPATTRARLRGPSRCRGPGRSG